MSEFHLILWFVIVVLTCGLSAWFIVYKPEILSRNITVPKKRKHHFLFFLMIFLSGVVLLSSVVFFSEENVQHFWLLFFGVELLFLAAITDIHFGIIPNRILAILISIWVLLVLITWDLQLFSNLIPAGSIMLLIFMINQISKFIIKKEGFGNGDLKLLGTLALFFGWEIFWIFYLAIIVGGLYSGILMIFKKKGLSSRIVFAPLILLGALLNTLGIGFESIFIWNLVPI